MIKPSDTEQQSDCHSQVYFSFKFGMAGWVYSRPGVLEDHPITLCNVEELGYEDIMTQERILHDQTCVRHDDDVIVCSWGKYDEYVS